MLRLDGPLLVGDRHVGRRHRLDLEDGRGRDLSPIDELAPDAEPACLGRGHGSTVETECFHCVTGNLSFVTRGGAVAGHGYPALRRDPAAAEPSSSTRAMASCVTRLETRPLHGGQHGGRLGDPYGMARMSSTSAIRSCSCRSSGRSARGRPPARMRRGRPRTRRRRRRPWSARAGPRWSSRRRSCSAPGPRRQADDGAGHGAELADRPGDLRLPTKVLRAVSSSGRRNGA